MSFSLQLSGFHVYGVSDCDSIDWQQNRCWNRTIVIVRALNNFWPWNISKILMSIKTLCFQCTKNHSQLRLGVCSCTQPVLLLWYKYLWCMYSVYRQDLRRHPTMWYPLLIDYSK